jgi:hypothetical protein
VLSYDERCRHGFTGKGFFDRIFENTLGYHSRYGINGFAPLKDHQGGDGFDTISFCGGGVSVDIAFGKNHLICVCFRQRFKCRCHGFAGGAPGCPEVYDNGFGLLKHLLVELIVFDFGDKLGHESIPP